MPIEQKRHQTRTLVAIAVAIKIREWFFHRSDGSRETNTDDCHFSLTMLQLLCCDGRAPSNQSPCGFLIRTVGIGIDKQYVVRFAPSCAAIIKAARIT